MAEYKTSKAGNRYRTSGMSKLARARYQRQRNAANGTITRNYDPGSDKYELQPAQLVNLTIGQEQKRAAANQRRATIARYREQGWSVADIVMATGISRAAVYRLMNPGGKDALLL